MNQESAAMAKGAYSLADVIYRQDGDLIKAEGLVRDALRLRTLVYGGDHGYVVESCCLLANILRAQKKLGDEARRLFERSLALSIKNVGPDNLGAAFIHVSVGIFYYQFSVLQPTAELKRAQLFRAKFHHEEAIRIRSRKYGPTHSKTIESESQLAATILDLSQI
jgi:hypothetical protein